MHCPECSVEVAEDAGFCHKCGARLEVASPPEPDSPQATGPEPTPTAGAEPPAPPPATSPGDRLQQRAAASQDAADDPEHELWRGGFSPKAMIGAWVLSGLISIVALIAGLSFAWISGKWWWLIIAIMAGPWVYHGVVLAYRRLNIRYQLTNQRFIHETGILRRVTNRIEVIDMDDIAFEQKLFERIVGVGTIRITSSDRTHPELVMAGIDEVKRIAGMMDDARRVERRRRGLHIESI